MNLPTDYLEFVKDHGGEGFFVSEDAYLALWKVENLATRNAEYQVELWAPGLLVFGSDGGGEAYGFDTRQSTWPIVMVPFIGMEWKVVIPVGDSFSDFLHHLRERTS